MIGSFWRLAFMAGLMLLAAAMPADAAPASQPRLALVVGLGAYAHAASASETTAVDDAGLIAYQLQQAGFDVTGGRDVDKIGFESLAATFVAKLNQAGPDAIAVVYVSGLGLQRGGDNRIVPVDASLANLDAIDTETISVNELLAQIETIPGAAHIAIFDLARLLPFPVASQVAPGLAALDAQQGLLVALSQQPGYLVREEKQGYGAYASALADAMRAPGLSLNELFARVRLRVESETKGGELPWNVSGLTSDFTFFAPETPVTPPPEAADLRRRPLARLPMEEAFAVAVEQDSIEAYQEFLSAFPDGVLAQRARAIIAARREALFWRRVVIRDTPQAYWTYLAHYPRGPHAEEARFRLGARTEPFAPPQGFREEAFDVPPPPPEEVTEYFMPEERWRALPPPPPPPVIILPPPIVEFYRLPAPAHAPSDILPPPAPLPLPPKIIPVPVPIPVPVLPRLAPLPLAVPPKPVLFPGGARQRGRPVPPVPAAPPPTAPAHPGEPPRAPIIQPLPVPGEAPRPAAPSATPGAAPQPPRGPVVQPLPVPGAAPAPLPRGPGATSPASPIVIPPSPRRPGGKPLPSETPRAIPAPPTPALKPLVPAHPGIRPVPLPGPAATPLPAKPSPPAPRFAPPPAPRIAPIPAPAPRVAPPAPRLPPPPAARPAPAGPQPARPAPGRHCTPQEHQQGRC